MWLAVKSFLRYFMFLHSNAVTIYMALWSHHLKYYSNNGITSIMCTYSLI